MKTNDEVFKDLNIKMQVKPSKIIYIKRGGLPEDLEWHWDKFRRVEGNTLQECCDNLAKQDKEFEKNYNSTTLSYNCYRLELEENVFKEGIL